MNENKDKMLDKILESAKETHLSAGEKSSMRLSLSRMADMTPVKSPFWTLSFLTQYSYAPALALLLFVVTGGAGIFAQSSLPGDSLYSIKINVNEKMESFLATSPKALAELDALHATRRLEEAEMLAVKGELTKEQNETIKQSFSAKVISLNTRFEKMEQNGETEVAVEVLKKFDLEVRDRVNNLEKSTSTAKGKKSATDIVAFIKTKHGEGDNTKNTNTAVMATSAKVADDAPKEKSANEPRVAVTATMSLTAPAPEAFGTSTATTTEQFIDNVDLEEKEETTEKIHIRWSWSEND